MRDEAGAIVCKCGCGRPPEKGRRYWHSEECVHEWKIRNQPPYARRMVFKRDQGICAICGVDTSIVRAAQEAAIREWRVQYPRFIGCGTLEERVAHAKAVAEHAKNRPRFCRHVWEADHIVPVVEGGGQTGIENYRTLCIACHREETKKLRARLAAKRKVTT